MLQQISRFSVHQTAKVLAILYLLLGLLLAPLVWLSSFADPEGAMPLWLAVLFPAFYGLFGYIFTVIGAAFYNFVAARVGGIEFTLSAPPPG